jgi:nucleotide-binding universal stress UspA family protein
MFRKLLVALDGSEAAACALHVASELADQLHANVVLLHVVNPGTVASPEMIHTFPPTLAEMKQAGEALLQEARRHLPALLHVQAMVLEGEPAETIVDAAAELEADLIILGSDSRGRLAHFLLGSTVDAVIRRARCPVLTVRRDGTMPPISEWRSAGAYTGAAPQC